MDGGDGNDSRQAHRSLGQRLDTVGKKVMAIVGAVGAIASAAAGVRALLPEDADEPEQRASVGRLRIHLEPLAAFQARERLIAAASVTPSTEAPVLVASAYSAADLLAQTVTPSQDTGTTPQPPPPDTTPQPPPTDTSPQPPPTATEALPSRIIGNKRIPGMPSGKGVLCVEDTSLSAKTPPLISTTPSTAKNPGSAPCQILYAIPPADLQKPPSELKKRADALFDATAKQYALSASCKMEPASQDCPLARGIHPRSVKRTRASRATRAEAAKLALIREQVRQLKHTKTVSGAGGKREPLGVRLDYQVRICGFAEESVNVFWTLFDNAQPPRIPNYWYSNRLANTIERNSSRCESVFPSFWVPIPRAKGPFTVALAVYDAQGVRRGDPVESRPLPPVRD